MTLRIREMIPIPFYMMAAVLLMFAGAIAGLFAFMAEGLASARIFRVPAHAPGPVPQEVAP